MGFALLVLGSIALWPFLPDRTKWVLFRWLPALFALGVLFGLAGMLYEPTHSMPDYGELTR